MEYGLIGEKLGHSFSPQIHQALGCKDYQLKPLCKEKFHNFMEKKNFCGINVTIPYKEAVFPYCDEISAKAKAIGAINTIKVEIDQTGKKKLYGDNTDFDGFLYLLQKNNINLTGKTVMILGTGGTSKTVMAVAQHCKAKKILTVSRNAKNGFIDYEQCKQEKEVQVIINTTPVGMYPNVGNCQVDLKNYPKLEAVVDVIFNPLETALLQQGRKLGIPAINGLEMLVAQAKVAEEIFFQKKIAEEKISEIYQSLKREINNLVLIGMPGCGKSTIGRQLAQKTGKQFIDTDSLLVEKAGRSIPDIFAVFGEDYFRQLEQEVIAEIGKEHGLVIATGGGIIKNEANIDALKQNGQIIFLDRKLTKLEVGQGRPLSANAEAVKSLYLERYPLYKKCCDIKVENNDTVEEAVIKILAGWEGNQ
ncbi:MAG: shikimate dehydrogenase [Peptococcaceae bacterium]|nr:shikimate dehydrogenase [Peptococcaceae bacterium]